jgi:hypothetical protein
MKFKSVSQFFVHSWSKGIVAEEFFEAMEGIGISRLESQRQLEILKDKGYLEIDSSEDVVLIKPLKDRKEFKKIAKAEEPAKGIKPIRIISLK